MGQTIKLNQKANVKQNTAADILPSNGLPVIAEYTSDSVVGQTLIPATGSLPFTIDTTAPQNLWLFINGQRLSYSKDFTFLNIDGTGRSSQIQLNSALSAIYPIVVSKLGIKPEVELGVDSRFTEIYDVQSQSFQGFVNTQSFLSSATTTTGAPSAGTFHSVISARASISDLSKDLKPRMGIERVMTPALAPLNTEFGPNGEQIYGAINDVTGQIRFGGTWFIGSTNYGQRPVTTTANDFVEVTFYGTALNFLTNSSNNGAYTIFVDGVSQGTFTPTATSNVIAPRSVATNQVQSVVSGLSPGIHTVRLQLNGATELDVYGFEFIYQNSTNVAVNPGIGYLGSQKRTNSAQVLAAYNSVVTGTTGGRVAIYQAADGSIGQVFNPAGATPSYMSAASHTNEEIVRVYNFREFGAGRSDDFTTTQGQASRAFTLDDGTTTLIGSTATYVGNINSGQPEGMFSNANSEIIAFTFVGTGLDIYNPATSNSAYVYTLSVDGNTIQTGLTGTALPGGKNIKICSGLPYGSHVVKFLVTTATGAAFQMSKFTVYQPKTPSIPSGAIQLGSYNVMANYVFNSASNTIQAGCSSGTLRKLGTREFNYTGTWSLSALDYSMPSGFNTSSSTNGSFFTYTFYGTGFEYRADLPGGALNIQISVDGSSNLSGFTTQFLQGSGATGATFTASTGTIGGTSSGGAYGSVTSVSGLALGLHTVKILNNTSLGMFADCIDVITPIHSYKSNLFSEQAALSVGSQAIADNRKITPVPGLAPTKASFVANGVISNPTTNAGVPTPCPDMSGVINVTTGTKLKMSFSISINDSTSAINGQFGFYVDGVLVQIAKQMQHSSISIIQSDIAMIPVSPGYHKVDVYWNSSTTGLTLNAILNQRTLIVEEV